MIDPARLAFDIDGVIADTMHLFLDILADHYDVHTVGYEDLTAYRLDACLDLDPAVIDGAVARILDGRYRADLKPISGALPVLKRIGETTGRILMVTARPEPELIQNWLQPLLDGQHHQAQIIATGAFEAKTEVLLGYDVRWFVEDRLETCHLLNAAGIEPIVFRQPWNQRDHDYLVARTWSELEQWIDFP